MILWKGKNRLLTQLFVIICSRLLAWKIINNLSWILVINNLASFTIACTGEKPPRYIVIVTRQSYARTHVRVHTNIFSNGQETNG